LVEKEDVLLFADPVDDVIVFRREIKA